MTADRPLTGLLLDVTLKAARPMSEPASQIARRP